ncbi:MAG: type I methionyl aminopeptidase [Planctomycetota bacterium]|nr:type I methionyl aminopeptidase [Planctomycetota bacterium]
MRLKSPAELEVMSRAGRAACAALHDALAASRPGVSTGEIDAVVERSLRGLGAEGLFRGYRQGASPPFPGTCCISVNEEIVHGIPGPRVLRAGDVVSIDVGLRLGGWCVDTARTLVVGGESGIGPAAVARESERLRLVEATRELLEVAISMMRPGRAWSAIALELERRAEATGFGLVTEYVGHGVGRDLHEGPKAPAYWSGFAGEDFELVPGLVLAVEPMLSAGRGVSDAARGGLPGWRMPVRLLSDGWTVVTADGSPAAHEEHTVAVTADGARVLTTAGA